MIDAIRKDSAWNGGDYKTQPPALRTAAAMLWVMSGNPILRQKEASTLAKTDEVLDKFVNSDFSKNWPAGMLDRIKAAGA